MPEGIRHSTKVDESRLDSLESKLLNILDVSDKINEKTIKPKADDSDIKRTKKSLDDLWKEARESQRTKLELWNTKTVQKDINKIKGELDEFVQSFDPSKLLSNKFTPSEKDFVKFYSALREYSKRFGQEISSEYKNVFDSIFENADFFKKGDIKDLFNENISQISESLNKKMATIGYEANKKYVEEQNRLLREQASEAKKAADAVKEAERQKREAYLNTRDKMVTDLKSAFAEMRGNAGEGQYLSVDEKSWGILQQKVFDVTKLLSEMGFEVKDIEDDFAKLQDKVYVPIDRIENSRNTLRATEEEVEKLTNEIQRLQLELQQTVDVKDYDKLREELELVEEELKAATDRASAFYNLWRNSGSVSDSEFNDLAARAYEYMTALEKANTEIDQLKQKLQSLTDSGKSTGNATDGIFDSKKADDYVNILTEIAKHLLDIKTALGTVDDENGFTNIIKSVDILLGKLDEMYQKIGATEITINKGNHGGMTDTIVSSERDRLMRAYTRISDNFGGDSELLYTMKQTLGNKIGLSPAEYYGIFNKNAISSIVNPMEQINRLRDFFHQYRDFQNALNESIDVTEQYISDLQKDAQKEAEKTKRKMSASVQKTDEDENKHKYKLNTSEESQFNKEENERKLKQAQQELEVYKKLAEQSSKNKVPSDYNTLLNKKLYEANQKELDLENEKVDLTQITDMLEKIRDLISEISQKDLFGESINNVIIKLDEILQKFEAIVGKVEVVNDSPIVTKNKGTVNTKVSNIKDIANKQVEQSAQQTVVVTQQVTDGIANVAESTNTITTATNQLKEGLEEVGEEAKQTNEIIVEAFRGINSANEKNNGYWTSSLEEARYFAQEIGDENYEVQKALLSYKNPFVIDNLGRDNNSLWFLGDGKDSISKQLLDLESQYKTAFSHIQNIIQKNNIKGIYTSGAEQDINTFIQEIERLGKEAGLSDDKIKILINQLTGYANQCQNIYKEIQKIFTQSNGKYFEGTTDQVRNAVGALGEYDGVIYKNVRDGDNTPTTHYATNYPTQISNRTTIEESAVRDLSYIDKLINKYAELRQRQEDLEKTKKGLQSDEWSRVTNEISEVSNKLRDLGMYYDLNSKKWVEDVIDLENEYSELLKLISNNDYNKISDRFGVDIQDINDVEKLRNNFELLISTLRNNNINPERALKSWYDGWVKGDSLLNKDELSGAFKSLGLSQLPMPTNKPVISDKTNSKQTTEATQQAADAIEAEGDAAEKASKQKVQFADANHEVAESATTTATATQEAINAIRDEGEASEETAKAENELTELYEEKSGQLSFFENEIEVKNEDKKTTEELAEAEKKRNEALKNIPGQITIDEYTESLKKAQQEADILNNKIEQQRQLLNNKTIKSTDGLDISDDLSNRIEAAKQKVEELKNKLNSINDTQSLNVWKTEFAAVKAEIDGVNKAIAEEQRIAKETSKAQDDLAKNQKKASSQASKDLNKQNKLMSSFQQWVSKNSLAYKAYGNEIDAVFKKLGSGAKLNAEELREVENEINRIKSTAASAGKLGSSLTNMLARRFKSLVAYLGTFASFYRIVGYIRSAFSTLVDLDTQLVDLRKTTSMTTSELNQFYNVSSDVAKELGVTTSEIISQASAWSRLGYSSKEAATEMAQLSSKFASISPGMTTDQSTDYLVSTMQAYGIAVDDVERKILDNVNRIGNILPKHTVTYGAKYIA